MSRPLLGALPVLALAAALAPAAPAIAQGTTPEAAWRFELSVPVSYAYGHTTYRIEASDTVNSVASELEFPIRTGLVGVRARLAGARQARRGGPSFEVSGLLSVRSQETAKMKDSDWLDGPDFDPGGVPGGLDIYSESNAELDAYVIEGRFAWEVDTSSPGVIVAPMLGAVYQRLDYAVSDATQVGYGNFQRAPVFIGGPVLEYGVTYVLPYLGGRAEIARGAFTGTAEAWFSPFAQADDLDDHLRRGKTARTDASGTALSAALAARFALGARSSLRVEASLVRISTSGTQDQHWYSNDPPGTSDSQCSLDPNCVPAGTEIRGIPTEITSLRATFGLAYVLSL
jgi:hypothetical protein